MTTSNVPTVVCQDDSEIEHFGFLWLKSRKKKIDGITQGKKYQIIRTQTAVYGSIYSYSAFSYLLILNDNLIPQLYGVERFSD
jgi:hypothetical protein